MKATYALGAGLLLVALIVGVVFAVRSADNQSPSQSTNQADSTNNGSSSTENNRSITMDEVDEHDKPDDCWMAIEGKVYDVTEFVSQHPGGDEIEKGCGEDATELFNTRKGTEAEGVPHSSFARDTLSRYQIGTLVQSD